ncbi:MAG TPA: 1-deoxy-D-xylulose-5-phosphate synthase [Verrucomicrobiae bacterium]|nr:1-deoxy-D-xylulose-5-phosphate synthase [Verrucomicrobiae bacterium]
MANLLDGIESPADLKGLSLDQLTVVAQEIRDLLIQTTAHTGGHLGPNLGIVELTLAWHYVFDSPKDRLLMDVSHQCYVHKILTGRRARFHTLRQLDGLNGFMLRTESPHDHFGAGHAGTALSAALGMAVGRDRRGGTEHITALCGDAAFTCGVTYEAMNNAADVTKRLIVVLNDNEWSIDKNVGAIAHYLNKIVTNETYSHLHAQAARFLERIGGRTALKLAHKVEESLKGLVAFPSTLFEELGFTYYGPLDGHDIPNLVQTFRFLKEQDHPVLLHALTKKGKGFDLAIEKAKKYHGIAPGTFDPVELKEIESKPGVPTYSQVFADTLVKLADMDGRVSAITGAMPNGTGLDRFRPKHPDKYYDVGIAEEHAVIFAAGLATQGLKPFCAIYSTFMQRAYDAIIHDVALQHLPVVFCMDRAGLSPDDGPTHHGLFDIAYLRCVPNLVHMQPKDEDEFADMLYTALLHDGPICVRYPRGAARGVKMKDVPRRLEIGKAELIREGSQVALWGLGNMLPMALEVADALEKDGVSCAVINPRFIKPLDEGLLMECARWARLIVTFEDHVVRGGFGSAALEVLSNRGATVPLVRIGWPDEFVEHGHLAALRAKHGLTTEAALVKIRAALSQEGKARA